ncbi:PREDICTED: uncharacterized protein LOC105989049 [Dipodomys ordii]|uniref:Uncharacterized protein LOC105989049 n=1 Tax=Dipodomys ordii TaxID=10020 RepID=A0A1S3FK83_DIPOR|nr:PREDICTED: uncharacterized protein LOC105989049 [Dipodomys ordii]
MGLPIFGEPFCDDAAGRGGWLDKGELLGRVRPPGLGGGGVAGSGGQVRNAVCWAASIFRGRGEGEEQTQGCQQGAQERPSLGGLDGVGGGHEEDRPPAATSSSTAIHIEAGSWVSLAGPQRGPGQSVEDRRAGKKGSTQPTASPEGGPVAVGGGLQRDSRSKEAAVGPACGHSTPARGTAAQGLARRGPTVDLFTLYALTAQPLGLARQDSTRGVKGMGQSQTRRGRRGRVSAISGEGGRGAGRARPGYRWRAARYRPPEPTAKAGLTGSDRGATGASHARTGGEARSPAGVDGPVSLKGQDVSAMNLLERYDMVRCDGEGRGETAVQLSGTTWLAPQAGGSHNQRLFLSFSERAHTHTAALWAHPSPSNPSR